MIDDPMFAQQTSSTFDVIRDVLVIVAAMTGAILGTLGFRRSGRVEHRQRHEPYFRSIWPELSRELTGSMSGYKNWARSLSRELRAGRRRERLSRGPSLVNLDVDNYNWRYDKSVESAIKKYLKATGSLEHAVAGFDELIRPTTDKFLLYRMLRNALPSTEEQTKRENELIERVKPIVRKYLGKDYPSATIADLQRNRKYWRALAAKQKRIRSRVKALAKTSEKLEAKLNYYDRAFPDLET